MHLENIEGSDNKRESKEDFELRKTMYCPYVVSSILDYEEMGRQLIIHAKKVVRQIQVEKMYPINNN